MTYLMKEAGKYVLITKILWKLTNHVVSHHNEVGYFSPMLCSMQPQADRMTPRFHHGVARTRRQKQPRKARPVDFHDGHNCPMVIRKMPGRFLVPTAEDVLVAFERSRDVSFRVGMGMSYTTRCDASVYPLPCASRGKRPV